MGELGLYLLMIIAIVAVVWAIILTYRWIKKIISLLKNRQYFRALFTFVLPVAVGCVVAYYIDSIIHAVLIGLAAFMAIGAMLSMKDNTIYYYSD